MEGQHGYNGWPLTPLDTRGSSNPQDHCFNLGEARNEAPYAHPTSLPHGFRCHQTTPQRYVQFLAEGGAQKKLLFRSGNTPPSFDKVGVNHQMIYQSPCIEGTPLTLSNLTSSDSQTPSLQNSSDGHSPAAIPVCPSTVPSTKPRRQRSSDADRRRRLRISEALQALQELLPHSKQGEKASLDDVIDYVKYLKFQIKEPSQTRSVGESSCTALPEELSEHLGEMMAKLLEESPLAGIQLLESKGLYILPMALSEWLSPQT